MIDDLLGKTIGKYEIHSEIGRGGMGIVYKGYHKSLDREVAIKVLSPHLVSDKQSVSRFIQEAKLIAKLNHENIVQIYDIEEKDSLFFIIMEYLEGIPLDKIIRNKALTVTREELVGFISQICSALECTHRHEIIHRDVKAANIFITKEKKAKLMDFGISKIMQSTNTTASAIGTPSYMSPEQIKGEPLDGLADIYSLGVVLYECLTEQLPFIANDPISVAMKHITEEPLPPKHLDDSIPLPLSRCVMAAMAKNKALRFHSCQDMAMALEGKWPDYLTFRPSLLEKLQTDIWIVLQNKMFTPGMTFISILLSVLIMQQIFIKQRDISEFESNKHIPRTRHQDADKPGNQSIISTPIVAPSPGMDPVHPVANKNEQDLPPSSIHPLDTILVPKESLLLKSQLSLIRKHLQQRNRKKALTRIIRLKEGANEKKLILETERFLELYPLDPKGMEILQDAKRHLQEKQRQENIERIQKQAVRLCKEEEYSEALRQIQDFKAINGPSESLNQLEEKIQFKIREQRTIEDGKMDEQKIKDVFSKFGKALTAKKLQNCLLLLDSENKSFYQREKNSLENLFDLSSEISNSFELLRIHVDESRAEVLLSWKLEAMFLNNTSFYTLFNRSVTVEFGKKDQQWKIKGFLWKNSSR